MVLSIIAAIAGGIARGAVMAGRGIVAGARGIGRGVGAAVKGGSRGIKKSSQWGIAGVGGHPLTQGIVNHPLTQKIINNPVTQGIVNHPLTQKIAQNPATRVIGGAAGLMGGLALAAGRAPIAATRGVAGAVNNVSQADKKTLGSVFALFAIILWIVDLTSWFGGIYSGFNFSPEDFWNNWFSEFTFGNVWFDLGLILIVIYIVVKYAKEYKLPNKADIISFSLFIITMVFFLANPGWIAYPKAVLHFLFILLFGLFYVKQTSSSNAAYLTIVGLLFFDFFFFSTIFKLLPLFKYISLLGAIIIIWTFAQSPSGFTSFLFVLLIILIMILTMAEGLPASGVFFEESEDTKPPLRELWDRITTGIGNYQKQVAYTLEAQIQYAVTGKVEENQYEPLGVYLENVQSADERYYADEDVIIWGTVKARTLDDPIDIEVGCYVKKDKEKIRAEKEDPKSGFTVFALEEQDFACTFTEEQRLRDEILIRRGSNTITAFADFNFKTLAYLKVYFIDNDRRRAMIREGIEDVLEEFDIKDKEPVPVYTNGPVAIEMGTTMPLVGVGKDNYPRFSLELKNRYGWEGKITSLKELVLLFPSGVVMEDLKKDCNKEFGEYKLIDCKNSCDEYKKDECVKECDLLLGGDNPEYVGYNLIADEIEKLNERALKEDGVESFRRFNCKINVTPDVLENTPITTKYFRVKAKYNYTLEKPITVKIVEDSEGIEEKGSISTTEPTTTPAEISSELGHFEAFIDGINEMDPGMEDFSLELDKESAIIGFSKDATAFECYKCDASPGSYVSIIVEKPQNAECSGEACACLCSKGFDLEYKDFDGGKATVGECQDLICRKLNVDIVDKLAVWVHSSYTDPDELAELLQNPNQYIKLWMNGFLFANDLDEASELNRLNNGANPKLYVEKKCIYGAVQEDESQCPIGVCNEDMLNYNEDKLELPEGTCIQ